MMPEFEAIDSPGKRRLPLLECASDEHDIRIERIEGHVRDIGGRHTYGAHELPVFIHDEQPARAVLGDVIVSIRTELQAIGTVIRVPVRRRWHKVLQPRPDRARAQRAVRFDGKREQTSREHFGDQQVPAVLRHGEPVGIVQRGGDLCDRPSVRPQVKHCARDRRLDIVRTRGGEIDPALIIRREIVRSDERPAAAVRAQHPGLMAGGIELHQIVTVIAADEQIITAGYQATGTAAILVPKDATARAVPGLDVARGVLDVKELAVAPEWALRVMRITIDNRDLLTLCAGTGQRQEPRYENSAGTRGV